MIIDEGNLDNVREENDKVHLIYLNFDEPTDSKVRTVLNKFPSTNRFIVSDNIKFYNNILKNNKKFYVENQPDVGLLSFFKKNNKVLLNMNNLSQQEREFVKTNIKDVLKNTEVIYLPDQNELDEN